MEIIGNLKISKDRFFALVLLLLLFFFDTQQSIELKYLVLLGISSLLFLSNQKLNKNTLETLFPIVSIFLIAFFSSLFGNASIYDFVRDSVHMTKPIVAIMFGYYFTFKIKDKTKIFKVIILFCFFLALIHIITILLNLKGEWTTSYLRAVGGKGSEIEAFGLSVFIVFLRGNKKQLFTKSFNRAFLIVVIISIMLYLSRTTFIAVVLFLLSFYGFTQLNRKLVFYLLGFIVFITSFMISLQFMDIERDSKGVESFFYKLKIAPSEIFDSEIDVTDVSQLWDNWRAYEAKKAIETIEERESVIPFIIGMGLGSQVDLDFEAPLGQEKMRYIPHLHNGYIYIFFKSGILGVFLLIVWLFYLYCYTYRRSDIFEKQMLYKIISGIGLYLLFSTLVITGIYNLGILVSIILGLMLGLTANNVSFLTANND